MSKEEKKEENIIKEEEKKDNSNIKEEKKEEENLEEISTNKTSNNTINSFYQEPEIDPNTYCHRIFYKGSNIDINQFELFSFIKIKEKGSFLSNLGFKNPKITQIPYFAFLNETYLYMIKDKVYDKKKPNIRRIGNKYSLFDCQNIRLESEDNHVIIHLDFLVSENEYKFKAMYFNKEFSDNFIRKLQEVLIRNGIVNINEGEEEEIENEDNKNEENEQEEKKDDEEDEKEIDNQEEENVEKVHKKKKKSKKKKEPDEEELK